MTDTSFKPAQQGQADFSATTFGRTLDADQFNMTVDVRYHDHCKGINREPNFFKTANEIFGPPAASMAIRELGVKYPSGKALEQAAKTPDGKANIEQALKSSVATVLGDFCLTTDSVELIQLKTTDH